MKFFPVLHSVKLRRMQSAFSRRRFLRTSLFAAAGASLSSSRPFIPAPVPQHIGLQLYSVRDDMARDPAGTLAAIGKMGYREVEAFNYNDGKLFGLPYADFSKLLKDNNLTMPSTHSAFGLSDYNARTGAISDATKKWVDAAAGLGLKYLICPWMREEDRQHIAGLVKAFQAMGQYCRKAGLRFGYHNHGFEFEQHGPDNRLLMEWILHEVDPTLLALQMDIYWVNFAKRNPLDWIRLYPGRWELCHVKDLADTANRETVEVGAGVIPFKTIFQKSQVAGFQYFIVELEHYRTTALQGVEKARNGLLGMF